MLEIGLNARCVEDLYVSLFWTLKCEILISGKPFRKGVLPPSGIMFITLWRLLPLFAPLLSHLEMVPLEIEMENRLNPTGKIRNPFGKTNLTEYPVFGDVTDVKCNSPFIQMKLKTTWCQQFAVFWWFYAYLD